MFPSVLSSVYYGAKEMMYSKTDFRMLLKCLKLSCEREIRLRMVNVLCVTCQICLSGVMA